MIGKFVEYNESSPSSSLSDPNFVTTIQGVLNNTGNVINFIGVNSKLVFKQEYYHCFHDFNINSKITTILGENYEARIGLIGSQVNNSFDMCLVVKNDGADTTLMLSYYNTLSGAEIIRKQRVISGRLEGDIDIRVNYHNGVWNCSIFNQGCQYKLTHRYQRALSQGNVTSRFGIWSPSGSTFDLKKMEVFIPLETGGTWFLGDSITVGSALPYGGSTFFEQYRSTSSNFIKNNLFACGSANSTDMRNCMKTILDFILPDKVILLVGDNDNYNDISIFEDNVLSIQGALGTSMRIMNLTPELYDTNYSVFRDLVESYFSDFIDSWGALASSIGSNTVNPSYVVDHVHLNQLGHNQIFNQLLIQSV